MQTLKTLPTSVICFCNSIKFLLTGCVPQHQAYIFTIYAAKEEDKLFIVGANKIQDVYIK